MKNILNLLFLAVFACTGLLLSACGSTKSDPTPTAQSGTLNGQITPATSVTTVTLTDAANKTTTTTPNSTGAYTFTGLAAGTYTLSFTAATGYTAPANQTGVVITAGGTTTATPVTAAAISTNNSASFSVGGVATSASLVLGNLQFNNLSVTIASASGKSVVFNIDGFTGAAGTFSMATQSTNSSQLIYSEQVGTSAQQWTTAGFLSNNQGTGSVVITTVGTNPRRVSGTFTATAYPATSASTGTRTITGSFTNVTY
ncbi:SdrD B-like domain-containing protein [Hymenobacter ruber]